MVSDAWRRHSIRAAHKGETAGKVLSDLTCRGIQDHAGKIRWKMVHGFEVLPAQGRVVTPQLVQRIFEKSRNVNLDGLSKTRTQSGSIWCAAASRSIKRIPQVVYVGKSFVTRY